MRKRTTKPSREKDARLLAFQNSVSALFVEKAFHIQVFAFEKVELDVLDGPDAILQFITIFDKLYHFDKDLEMPERIS